MSISDMRTPVAGADEAAGVAADTIVAVIALIPHDPSARSYASSHARWRGAAMKVREESGGAIAHAAACAYLKN
jgi:hypothetical protein